MCENPDNKKNPLRGKPEVRGGESEEDFTGVEEALQATLPYSDCPDDVNPDA
jgi:hypothetical protein